MIKKILYLFIFALLFSASIAKASAADKSVLRLIIGGSTEPSQACKNNPQNCLKDDFNFTVQGNPSKAILLDVYTIFLEASASTKYKQLLKSSGPTKLVFEPPGSVGNCPAHVFPNGDGTSTLTLTGYSLSGCTRQTRKSRLIHESGHVLRNGHMRLFQQFEAQAYNKDNGCYKYEGFFSPPYFINTYDTSYARSLGASISGSNESMAEFMALSVIPNGAYPRKCPTGLAWVKNNIYGGYLFK